MATVERSAAKKKTVVPRLVRTPSYEEASARLEFLVDRGSRVGLLTGERGSGKTTLLGDFHDNLRRSGRIGTAASWLGTALSLKPLLCLDVDGRLVLSQRIRTVTKARAALVEAVADVVGEHPATLAVHHVDNHEGAVEVAEALTVRLPQLASPSITDMGPVLSVHVGGGSVGVCVTVAD